MPDFLPERARRFIQAPILQTAPVFTADEPLLAAAGLHLRSMKKASAALRAPAAFPRCCTSSSCLAAEKEISRNVLFLINYIVKYFLLI